jgi:hypothetical protein
MARTRHCNIVQPAGIDMTSELSDSHHHAQCFNDIHSRQTFAVRVGQSHQNFVQCASIILP